jgi:hypothetical protein
MNGSALQYPPPAKDAHMPCAEVLSEREITGAQRQADTHKCANSPRALTALACALLQSRAASDANKRRLQASATILRFPGH